MFELNSLKRAAKWMPMRPAPQLHEEGSEVDVNARRGLTRSP
jgi:hypothetical protein